eukprot:CAMPEP_0175045288 /NCGR_PEP_ID=MMETSP0052_2-20121109/4320_1 /TAXON_ID=51329 ORGANISM="Polytomella parva, Strain SAG 63-3" /NCGR_SAMPLE_ID=MMETSP0052_2 /ASSEMBLY_ACC=CAM_ASM_000194 /LENGTH=207 /DNA_ID=CAMNT_0016308763 /DNA_START=269 /DNA_END=892 /DNA_ORIENTATION=-
MYDLGEELKKTHPDFSPLDFNAEALGLESSRYRKYDDWNTTLTNADLSLTNASASVKKSSTATASKAKRPKEDDIIAGGSNVKKKPTAGSAQTDVLEDVTALAAGTGEEVDYPMAFMSPPPAGFKASGSKPQSNGPFQKESDISASLVGRHAELFWPDDNSWYLIEIQSVDVEAKTARVVYITGETEDLSLEETAQDRHMVLVPLHL